MKPSPLLLSLLGACLLLGLAELGYTKHPHVRFEHWFNFYGFCAMAATAALLGLGTLSRAALSRDEEYYDG